MPPASKMVLFDLTAVLTVVFKAMQEMCQTTRRVKSPAFGKFRRNDGEGITSPLVHLLCALTTSEADDRPMSLHVDIVPACRPSSFSIPVHRGL